MLLGIPGDPRIAMHPLRKILALTAAFLWLNQAAASPTQSHESIHEAARGFLAERYARSDADLEIEVDRLDRRLRLSHCDRGIEAFAAPSSRGNGGRVTVGVRCDGSQPWSIYLPARVSLYRRVVVASREIPRGDLVRSADLRLERRDVARLKRGYFLSPDDVLGQQAKRRVGSGRVLVPGQVKKPLAVTRGSRISIVAQIGGIEARMPGTALENGHRGERIRIENLATEKELEARIVSAGVVRVDI